MFSSFKFLKLYYYLTLFLKWQDEKRKTKKQEIKNTGRCDGKSSQWPVLLCICICRKMERQ